MNEVGINSSSIVALYQLLFQHWKKRPGLLAPRTIIVTDTHVFLCTEDHGEIFEQLLDDRDSNLEDKVTSKFSASSTSGSSRKNGKVKPRRLRIVDSAALKDIREVRPEDKLEQVTILVKRPIKAKRWRLLLNSRLNAQRLVQEIRRRSEEFGEIDTGDRPVRESFFKRATSTATTTTKAP